MIYVAEYKNNVRFITSGRIKAIKITVGDTTPVKYFLNPLPLSMYHLSFSYLVHLLRSTYFWTTCDFFFLLTHVLKTLVTCIPTTLPIIVGRLVTHF